MIECYGDCSPGCGYMNEKGECELGCKKAESERDTHG